MRLTWRDATRLPVDFDGVQPAELANHSTDEVLRITVRVGNRRVPLGELFQASDAEPGVLAVEGDLRGVQGIGRRMAGGTLIVRGDVGAHPGAEMTGGTIEIQGSVGPYAFAEMAGGFGLVHGDAGRGLGAAYPGARLGMREGVVVVDGSVGEECGFKMRRGLIAVKGRAGDWFGRRMIAGSLFAFGGVGEYPGAGMKRGTIALLGPGPEKWPPGFASTGRHRFPFLAIYLKQLEQWGVAGAAVMGRGEFERYNGDLVEGGQGEILVRGA